MIYGGILVTTQSPKVNCGAVDGKPLKPALDMGLCGFRIIPTEEFRLNFVAADTGSWEQAAALQLEMAAQQGLIACYVRNDRLELTVPYEFYEQARAYEPDFVVRLADGCHLLLEVKGAQPAEVAAKHQAAQRWVGAVNRWGQLGVWDLGFWISWSAMTRRNCWCNCWLYKTNRPVAPVGIAQAAT